jgi:hypothetical protein
MGFVLLYRKLIAVDLSIFPLEREAVKKIKSPSLSPFFKRGLSTTEVEPCPVTIGDSGSLIRIPLFDKKGARGDFSEIAIRHKFLTASGGTGVTR